MPAGLDEMLPLAWELGPAGHRTAGGRAWNTVARATTRAAAAGWSGSRNGAIAYAVDGITIAGQPAQHVLRHRGGWAPTSNRGSHIRTGSILVGRMTGGRATNG
jgi:hypothetical protein